MASEVFRIIRGLHLSKHFSDEMVLSTLAYKPQPGDLFPVSYPKSGSTWTQHIMYNILMDAEQSTNPFDLLIRFPCLELQGAEAAVHAPKPSVFRSHLPFNKIPYSPEAKYVYIARNPYDSCVSFYYHTRDIPFYQFRNGTFDQFFELFMQGRVEHGEYFENVISWYEHRNDSNVLFLTYEELKKDTRDNVLKIAAFMGSEKEEKLMEDPKLLNRVLENTSLEHMKRLLNYDAQKPPLSKSPFLKTFRPEILKGILAFIALVDTSMTGDVVRNGQVGDWRNHFSLNQIRQIKYRIAEASVHSDFMSLWKDVDIR